MSSFFRLWVHTGILVVFLLGCGLVQADPASDSTVVWKAKSLVRLGGSQASFQNWTEGGLNSVSLRTGYEGDLKRESTYWKQSHELRLKFGVLKQDTLAFRKAEDLLLYNVLLIDDLLCAHLFRFDAMFSHQNLRVLLNRLFSQPRLDHRPK